MGVLDEFGNSTMAKLTNFLDNKYACETMAVIFHAASNDSNDNWIQRKVAGPLNGQLLIKDLIAQLGHYLPEVRYWVLTCLAQIYPKNEAFSQMLLAESTEPSLKLFRERSKFLTNLALDSPPLMNCKDEDIKIGVFRFLLAQLSVNLKPLWENSFKVIETYGADGDMEGFWSVWLEIFKEMNVKAASTPDQGNLLRGIDNKTFDR